MTHEERFERIEANLERVSERMDKQEAEIDKNTAAIKDLIVVSRTVLTSIEELREAQKHTDEKLNILIDTVDRMAKSWQKPNGNQ